MSSGTMRRSSLLGRLLDRRSMGRGQDPDSDGPRRGGTGRSPLRSPKHIAIAVVVVIVLLGGGWLWFRDSSLVAVRSVSVTGLTGQNAKKIRRALIVEARTMTTLDVNLSGLHGVVAPYPEVLALHVSTHFPHGMSIAVVEQYPVAVVSAGGVQTEVASDGVLLHQGGSSALPTIPLPAPPGGMRVSDHGALQAIAVLVAAPYRFLPRIASAAETAQHGVVLQLRSGPAVYFGSTDQLALKWQALVDVLADAGSAGATYIDVSDPQRPAAGGGSAAVNAAIAAGLVNSGTTTSPAAPTSTTAAPSTTNSAASATTTNATTNASPASTTPAVSQTTTSGGPASAVSGGTTTDPTGGAGVP